MDGLEPIALMPHLWIVLVVALLIIAGGFAFLIAAKRTWRRGTYNDGVTESGYFIGAVLSWVFGTLTLITAVALFIPFDGRYHQFFHASGEVISVTNSFIESSGDLSSVPIVVVDGLSYPVSVDDQRILKMQGEVVDLTCAISWVPYGRDRINCFIAG